MPPTARRSLPRRQRLVVSSCVFTCCWCIVVLVHLVCIVFTAALAGAHALVSTPAMYTYTGTTLQIDMKYLRLTARAFTIVSLLHVVATGRIVFHSLRRRQLCFRANSTTIRTGSTSIGSQKRSLTSSSTPHSTSQSALAMLTWPLRFVVAIWSRYFGIDGLFGLNGVYFDIMFHCREVLEVLSQTYQAYFLSSLMSSPWINRFAVGIIVAGCLSTPTIHVLVRRGQLLRRFLCLVIDTTLDLCGSVLIPMVIMYANVRAFNWHTMVYPNELVYDNVWMTQQISQMRMLFVWSYLDFCSTLILQLSVLGCILTIENSIVTHRRSSATAPAPLTPAFLPVGTPSSATSSRRSTRASIATKTKGGVRPRGRVCSGLHAGAIFLAWGVCVLIVHLDAQRDTSAEVPSCMVDINSWLSKRAGCAAVRVNCHRLGIAGSAEEVAAILEPIERSTLGLIAIMHCPGMVMPDILQEFSQLMAIELTNVTLRSWPISAAIHRDHHPVFSHIFLGHVTLNDFPAGLLHPHLPLTLTDFDSSFTNLTTLPEALGEMWSNRLWLKMHIEHANLLELPASFARVPIRRLSLIGNNLTTIRDDTFVKAALSELHLSGNPLEKLPATLGDTSTLELLVAEHTLIKATNAWWDEWYTHKTLKGESEPVVLLYGSPICNSSSSTNNESLSLARQSHMCAADMGTVSGLNSWDLIWRLRPV